MKQLVCEMCGSKDLIKDGGVFVCQSCGCKYTVEEAKKMMIEGTVRVDNTHMIENYLSMANNAYRSSNNSEAENYCNKVIEIDPTNYQALMLKGKTAGWQSTLGNNRFEEAINCFSSAIDHAPEEEKEALTNEAVEEVKNLSLALTKLQGDRFEKWPDEEETVGLLNVVVEIYKALIHFASNIGYGLGKDELMSPIAQAINKSVIGAWNNIILPEYSQDSDGHPDRYALAKLIDSGDYCIKLLEQANDLSDGDDAADINRLENMIAIQEVLIEGCAYEYKTVETGTDWWDGSTLYGNRYVKTAELTDQAKASRRKLISDYRNKISGIKTSIARKEAAEKAERERKAAEKVRKAKEQQQRKVEAFWQEHQEEKEQLIAEKHSLEQNRMSIQREYEKAFGQMKDQKVAIRAENNRVCSEIDNMIASANEELKQLGLFKAKEKKDIREKIDQLTAKKNETKREYDAKLALLDKDIERIKKEAEDKIRPISNRIGEVEKAISEAWAPIAICSVGDTIAFGHYPQKQNGAPELIEWTVLDKTQGRALVISKFALDCKQYNTALADVTWKTCSLRKWLNGTFLNTAFSTDEQNRIISTTLIAIGSDTTDKVFLLSIPEINKYFSSSEERKCAATDYAIAQGSYTSTYTTGGRATCWWWLRSFDEGSDYIEGIAIDGGIGHNDVNKSNNAVRPAMWINLSAGD